MKKVLIPTIVMTLGTMGHVFASDENPERYEATS